MKLNVYGRKMEIVKSAENWKVFFLGDEGKKRPVYDIIIPQDLKENEIINYIDDLFHEWATPLNNKISQLE
jgi:hypothetical protein